jgi:hypothetical protein
MLNVKNKVIKTALTPDAIALAAKYEVKMLSPEETAELLPQYPGFGVQRRG